MIVDYMELWLIFALSSALIGGMSSLMQRYILRSHDFVSYAFLFQILSGLFFIPLMLFDFKVPTDIFGIEIVLLGIVVWTITSLCIYKSVQMLEISIGSPVGSVKILFLLLLSYFLLSESLTTSKIIGTLSIFLGMFILTYRKGASFSRLRDKGVQLTIFSAFMLALASIVDKTALRYWSVPTYSFFVFFFVGIAIGTLMKKRFDKLIYLVRKSGSVVVLASILVVAVYYLELQAYKLTDVSNVYPIARFSLFFTVFGGIIFLKERKDILQKILGVIPMFLGILFISGYLAI